MRPMHANDKGVSSITGDLSPSDLDTARHPARGVVTMSVAEAADALGVGAHTVRRMIARGTLTPLPARGATAVAGDPHPGSGHWHRLDRREVMRVKRALAVVRPIRHRDANPTTGELSARSSPVSTVDAPSAPRRAGGGDRRPA